MLDALETLPPLAQDFITANERTTDMENLPTLVTDEIAVIEIYGLTTARYCSRMASTLALHPSSHRWGSLLFWTHSAPFPDYSMDGRLLFIQEGYNDEGVGKIARAAIAESMDN